MEGERERGREGKREVKREKGGDRGKWKIKRRREKEEGIDMHCNRARAIE